EAELAGEHRSGHSCRTRPDDRELDGHPAAGWIRRAPIWRQIRMPSCTSTMQLWRFGTLSISARQSKQTPIMQYGIRSLPPAVSRMLLNPAASTAAAAEAPTGTAIGRPSNVTETVARGVSGRGRNIEPPGREGLERRVEHAGGDHRREESGVRPGEGDAAVAIRGESPGKTLRLVIDRQPVGRHHPQCSPGADDLQIAQPGKRKH